MCNVCSCDCREQLDSKHEAASAYVDAANCYKKSQPQEAVRMLNYAINMFEDIGRLSMAAKHYKVL
jgi:alpha-soluble NSF attachment protein